MTSFIYYNISTQYDELESTRLPVSFTIIIVQRDQSASQEQTFAKCQGPI